MKPAEKEILDAFLGETLNLPADKVAQLYTKNGEEYDLKPEAKADLLAHDATRVKSFKDKNDEMFLNGQKKATKEIMSDFEKKAKEKFAIESDKVGLELFEEIVEKKTVTKGSLDDDKVKAHPAYMAMEKALNLKVKETETTLTKKYEDREAQWAEETTFNSFLNVADREFLELKPILPSKPEKAENQKKLFRDELKSFKFQKQDDDFVVLKPDGTRHEDKHGKPITYKQLVKEIADKYFDFEEGENREGSGGQNNSGQGAGQGQGAAAAKSKWTGKVPTNDVEYSEAASKTKTAEERVNLLNAYEEYQAKGK